jgi:D-alanyl-D-alanine carboxypeptidase (penicillin-binding protein 5/6)
MHAVFASAAGGGVSPVKIERRQWNAAGCAVRLVALVAEFARARIAAFDWLRHPALLLGLAVPALLGSAAPKATRPPYLGAIVEDCDSGKVIFEDNADVVSPPASMTKLMTFAVVHDKLADGSLRLDTPVTVTAADSRIGGTQVWLKEGEVFPVEDLLYAMMIQSGNDAAHALARTAAGTPAAFVELMNAKARALGMNHTTFRTPHGLPPASRRIAEGDLTSPRDYIILSRYLLRETDITKYAGVRERDFGASQRPADRVIKMVNHNHLLGKVAGVDGLKTGFTNGAGYCLAATAERNGRRVLVVVMGSPDSKTRDFKVMELLERGFAGLPALAAPAVVKTGAGSTSAPTGARAATPATPVVPTVKTDKTAPAVQSSTPQEPVIIFRIPSPSEKKP